MSQARALGAVDVLPKAVQPGVLFEMLLKLGLVSERRTSDRPVDDTSEQQTSETSVQALVSRILEHQHLKLRSDILQSQRDFARQVVTEVLNSRTHEESGAVDTEHRPQPANQPRSLIRIGLVVAPLVVLFVLYLQTSSELDAALARTAVAEQRLLSAQSTGTDLRTAVDTERFEARVRHVEFLGAMQWALNQGSQVGYGELAYNEARTDLVRELLTNLAFVGFTGTVRLESHLGEFCLVTDTSGSYILANAQQPVEACTLIGHPLDDSSFVSDRQTIGFANFLTGSA
ncbi:MAG: hypothetical protein VB948_07010, partial [Pseudomonadales bacterium]